MAITHLDKRKARREVMLSILVPLLVMVTSGAGIFLLNTKPVQRLVLTPKRSASIVLFGKESKERERYINLFSLEKKEFRHKGTFLN